jgi:hypothetical protein
MRQPAPPGPRQSTAPRRPSRPPQRSSGGDVGILIPLFLGFLVVACVGFWPAMVWHGYNDTGGWRWDIHSTVAELVYFGVIVFGAGMIWLGVKVSPKVDPAPTRLPWAPLPHPKVAQAPPVCTHRSAVKVENILNPDGPAWRYLCLECGPPEGTELPPEFGTLRRDCCGTIAGTSHLSNCPEWKPS